MKALKNPQVCPSQAEGTTIKPRVALFPSYTINKYLSETRLMDSLNFDHQWKVSINAPTGSGKSYYILNYLKENNIPFVFVADTAFLGKQLATIHNIAYYDATCGSKPTSNQVVTLYNHTDKFTALGTLIMDESHCLVTTNDYRADIIEENLIDVENYSRIIMLSGTPVKSNDEFYNDIMDVTVEYSVPVKREIQLVDYVDVTGGVVDIVKVELAKGKKVVVSMLNKSDDLFKIKKALSLEGITRTASINSTSRNGDNDIESEYYEQLLNSKEGQSLDVDVIFTTYTQGYSLYGTDYSLIIVPSANRHSYIDIVQMMARFREMDQFNAYMLYKSPKESKGLITDIASYMKSEFDKTVLIAEEAYKALTANKRSERSIRAAFKLNPSNYKYVRDRGVRIDYQAAALAAVNNISKECYNSINNFNEIMKQFNLSVTMKHQSDGKSKVQITKEELTVDKTELIDSYVKAFIDKTEEVSSPELFNVNMEYNHLIGLGIEQSIAINFLKENYGKPKKYYKQAMNELELRFSTNTLNTTLRNLAFKSFKKGSSYNSDQIFEIVSDIFNTVGKTQPTSKKMANEFIKGLIEMEENVKRVDGKIVRVYTVKGNK